VPATHTTTATATRTFSSSESDGGLQFCIDGIDNDNNGSTDCADEACASLPLCTATAPAASPPGMIMLALMLALIGLLGLSRSRAAPPVSA
jgi:MYXO-CTERM domain-containing protein